MKKNIAIANFIVLFAIVANSVFTSPGQTALGITSENNVPVEVQKNKFPFHKPNISKPIFPNVQAVIFDLDGVITNTAGKHESAWRQLTGEIEKEKGIKIPFNDFKSLNGIGREDCMKIILEGSYQPNESEFKKWVKRKDDIYKQSLGELGPKDILPGVVRFIHALKSQGIKVAVGSSSKNTPIILRQIGLSGTFDVVVDGNQITRGKPDPEVFLKAATKLDLKPENCLVIEDAQSGINAAKSAGMKTIGVVPSLKGADVLLNGLDGIDAHKYFSDYAICRTDLLKNKTF